MVDSGQSYAKHSNYFEVCIFIHLFIIYSHAEDRKTNMKWSWGFLDGVDGKESTCQCRRHRRLKFDPWVRKILWSRKWQTTLLFLSEKLHGQRGLVGYSLWGCKELDMTEQLNTHEMVLVSKMPSERPEDRDWFVIFA